MDPNPTPCLYERYGDNFWQSSCYMYLVSQKLKMLQEDDCLTKSQRVIISGPKSNLVLMTCYCPPNPNAEVDFEMENEIRKALKEKSVITADFNYPQIDWINACSIHNKEIKFCNTLNDCGVE